MNRDTRRREKVLAKARLLIKQYGQGVPTIGMLALEVDESVRFVRARLEESGEFDFDVAVRCGNGVAELPVAKWYINEMEDSR